MLTDASPFSRALWYIDVDRVRKFTEKRDQIIVGRGTNLDGYLVEVESSFVQPSKAVMSNGKELELVSRGDIFSEYRVAPGLTFRKLLDLLKGEGVFPALMPTYLEGTVGGFVATNGSGIGSYKFGFVKGKKEVHRFDGEGVIIKTVRYEKLLVLENENPLAWTGELFEGHTFYYVPDIYEDLVGKEYINIVNLADYISKVTSYVSSFLKKGNVLAGLRVGVNEVQDVLAQMKPEKYYGYVIKNNAPSKEMALVISLPREQLDDFFNVLRRSKSVKPYLSLRDFSRAHQEILKEFRKREILVPRQFRGYSELYFQAASCINCGLCLDSCKAFQATGNILYSPPGKYGQLLISPEALEACFGCEAEASKCPVGIEIGKVNIEFINNISKNKLHVSIDTTPLPNNIKSLEAEINRKYANRSVFILFVGCAYKYDPGGVERALRFLYNNGDELKPPFSPRVKIIDGKCCGFSDYMNGNISAAKSAVDSIERERVLSNAVGVYFFCPEGLYVYRKFGGNNGYLLYEAVKDFAEIDRDKLNIGCWGKKVGLEGEVRECAALSITNYHTSPILPHHRDYVTVCPFASWKFMTDSVYSKLKVNEVLEVQQIPVPTATETRRVDAVNKLINEVVGSYANALTATADLIAEKVNSIQSGGYSFFTLVVIPLLSNALIKSMSKEITSKKENSDILAYVKSIANDQTSLQEVSGLIVSALRSLNTRDLAVKLQKAILSSAKLDYNYRGLVESNEMVDSLEKAIKQSISPRLVEQVLRSIAFSA